MKVVVDLQGDMGSLGIDVVPPVSSLRQKSNTFQTETSPAFLKHNCPGKISNMLDGWILKPPISGKAFHIVVFTKKRWYPRMAKTIVSKAIWSQTLSLSQKMEIILEALNEFSYFATKNQVSGHWQIAVAKYDNDMTLCLYQLGRFPFKLETVWLEDCTIYFRLHYVWNDKKASGRVFFWIILLYSGETFLATSWIRREFEKRC